MKNIAAKEMLEKIAESLNAGSFRRDFVQTIVGAVNEEATLNATQESFVLTLIKNMVPRQFVMSNDSHDEDFENYKNILPIATYINSCH